MAAGRGSMGGAVQIAGAAALLAGALASSGAQAQCTGPGTQFGGAGSINALTSVIGTVNTAFLTAGSAYVATPASGPDQQGGGVWVRTVGGTAETQSNSVLNGSFNFKFEGRRPRTARLKPSAACPATPRFGRISRVFGRP